MSKFTDAEFAALLSWRMQSDPSPIDAYEDAVIKDMLDAEAEKRGYSDWIEAAHEL